MGEDQNVVTPEEAQQIDNRILLKAQAQAMQESKRIQQLEAGIEKAERQVVAWRNELVWRRGALAALQEVQVDRPTPAKPEETKA